MGGKPSSTSRDAIPEVGSVLAERLGIFARRLEQLTEPTTCVECCTCGLCESDALMFMSI